MHTQRFSGGSVHDEWNARSSPLAAVPGYRDRESAPGIYALYQDGVLKYVGQSRDCAARIHHHRTKGRAWLEAKPEWESGTDFTARILPLPGLSGGRRSPDGRMRRRWAQYWVYHLRPPCNRHPSTEPPCPPTPHPN